MHSLVREKWTSQARTFLLALASVNKVDNAATPSTREVINVVLTAYKTTFPLLRVTSWEVVPLPTVVRERDKLSSSSPEADLGQVQMASGVEFNVVQNFRYK